MATTPEPKAKPITGEQWQAIIERDRRSVGYGMVSRMEGKQAVADRAALIGEVLTLRRQIDYLARAVELLQREPGDSEGDNS